MIAEHDEIIVVARRDQGDGDGYFAFERGGFGRIEEAEAYARTLALFDLSVIEARVQLVLIGETLPA